MQAQRLAEVCSGSRALPALGRHQCAKKGQGAAKEQAAACDHPFCPAVRASGRTRPGTMAAPLPKTPASSRTSCAGWRPTLGSTAATRAAAVRPPLGRLRKKLPALARWPALRGFRGRERRVSCCQAGAGADSCPGLAALLPAQGTLTSVVRATGRTTSRPARCCRQWLHGAARAPAPARQGRPARPAAAAATPARPARQAAATRGRPGRPARRGSRPDRRSTPPRRHSRSTLLHTPSRSTLATKLPGISSTSSSRSLCGRGPQRSRRTNTTTSSSKSSRTNSSSSSSTGGQQRRRCRLLPQWRRPAL